MRDVLSYSRWAKTLAESAAPDVKGKRTTLCKIRRESILRGAVPIIKGYIVQGPYIPSCGGYYQEYFTL